MRRFRNRITVGAIFETELWTFIFPDISSIDVFFSVISKNGRTSDKTSTTTKKATVE